MRPNDAGTGSDVWQEIGTRGSPDVLTLEDLLERVKGATKGDRELDLAVHLALDPDGEIARFVKYRRGFDGKEGYAWDILGECVCFEKYDAHGSCSHNGGIPLRRFTGSVDAVAALCERVLPGWTIGGLYQGDNKLWTAELREGFATSYGRVVIEPRDGKGLPLALALLAALLSALVKSRSPSLVG